MWSWFTSFLQGHSQLVLIEDEKSDPLRDPSRVAMFSALFNKYKKLLEDTIHHHRLRHQQYADDIQLYISVHGELSNVVTSLS